LGKSWLQCAFLFAEGYFYRRVLQLTEYFNPRAPTFGVDPYELQKQQGLDAHRPHFEPAALALESWVVSVSKQPSVFPQDALAAAVLASLWGNKADLSLWPVQGGAAVAAHAAGSDEVPLSP
jgi:hypothetical protein